MDLKPPSRLQLQHDGGLALDAGGTRQVLSVAQTYKHMGSISRPDGKLVSEIRSRAAQAHAALAKLVPRAHRSPVISRPVKRVVNNAVV